MTDDILVMILSLLPMKEAVVTSILSTRWRFLWCNLIQLNFDGTKTYMPFDQKRCAVERDKYINQVNSVIKTYNNQKVQDFRICFDLDYNYSKCINNWLRFAADKKVEMLELNLKKHNSIFHSRPRLPSFDIILGKMVCLNKLILKGVDVRQEILLEVLATSPNLETLSVHYSDHLTCIDVGGQYLKLKHFEVVQCGSVKSIQLYDFGLESFTYKGQAIKLRFTDLPKLKELEINEKHALLENNVLGQISSGALYLQVLCLELSGLKENFKLDSVPELPNVKILRLTIGAFEMDSLLEFASIANACPHLETFTVEQLYSATEELRKKIRRVVTRPHEHLKLFQFIGYHSQVRDLELVMYIIYHMVSLEKIVVGPLRSKIARWHDFDRSIAKLQLEPMVPSDVELVIL